MLFQEKVMRIVQINRCGTKKERKSDFKRQFLLLSPKCRRMLPEKVSLCTSWKGFCGKKAARASMAVETALVLPLFFLGMVTIISFMDIYKVQTEHLTKLCEKAKQAGMYAYVLEGGGQEEITLPDVYQYKPVGGLVPLPTVWMYNHVKVHAWTGVEYEESQDTGEVTEIEKMVYMTDSGTVYHKSLSCSYLDLSVNQVSGSYVSGAANQYGEKYTACEICSRNQKPGGSVYITQQGNRYHNLGSCSGLKRSVRLVKESDASDVCACSRCG